MRPTWRSARGFRGAPGCLGVPGRYDVQTVLLHENGHVAGLDDASSSASVMYPFSQAARCSLEPLDQQAITTLYPSR